MTDKAHFDAVAARIEALAALAGKRHTAVRLDDSGDPVRANYVVQYPLVPILLDDQRYTARQSVTATVGYEFDVRAVAVDADGLMLMTGAVKSQLVDHTLVVAGRECWPIMLETPGEPARYDKTARLHYVDMTFNFRSVRSS